MAFPIDHILADLKQALQDHANVVVIAPPGAGKTTQIPLALLKEAWLQGLKIIMLEPRRIAARAVARYMAGLLQEKVGQTVGYRVRFDTKVSSATKLEIVTEGVLTRMLQADPSMEGIGLIIFDEFHERNLQADLGLALCLQSQEILREDLKILVMSATLAAESVAALLAAPVIESEGKAYPVEMLYAGSFSIQNIEQAVTQMILKAIRQYSGNILVFLPGVGEIRRVEKSFMQANPDHATRVVPLHGSLSSEQQDFALQPLGSGLRKVVLATSIAETSLTVEGIQVVIDSGFMRIPRFSPRTGMTRLETVRVSLASAQQRAGRAGRLGPGVCIRMWTKQEETGFCLQTIPEIIQADLAPLTLELAAWGVSEPTQLRWLDIPPAAAFNQARELLCLLGACDAQGAITGHGRQMAGLGCHPRLAHMLLKGIVLGCGRLACEIAALLNERDILRGSRWADADVRTRIELIHKLRTQQMTGEEVDSAACRRVIQAIHYWEEELGVGADGQTDIELAGALLALAYPDRIAQNRGDGRFLLQNGRGAKLEQDQLLKHEPYIVAVDLDDKGSEGRIFLAAPVTIPCLLKYCGEQLQKETSIYWDGQIFSVKSRRSWRLGRLCIKDEPLLTPDADAVWQALLQGIAAEGLKLLPWTKSAKQLQSRLIFMRHIRADWPDMTDSSLLAYLEAWLGPYLYGMTSSTDLQRLNLTSILEASLTWQQRQELDVMAPTHIIVPSGQRIAIDYSDPSKPVLAVRLQEMFGQVHTPCIANGTIPLTLHLLSPANRPVQVTSDLASFWQTVYFDVKCELQGRYPKHYWPEDPLVAIPTHRVKPRNK